jgi:hypothetical protein
MFLFCKPAYIMRLPSLHIFVLEVIGMATAQTNKKLIADLRKLVKDLPIEVLGHVDASALCCRSGTVALVKVDKGDPAPLAAKKAKK